MDRGAWWATIHGVAKSRTRLSDLCVCVCVCLSKHFRGFVLLPWVAGIRVPDSHSFFIASLLNKQKNKQEWRKSEWSKQLPVLNIYRVFYFFCLVGFYQNVLLLMNILSSFMYIKCKQRSIMCLAANFDAKSRKCTGYCPDQNPIKNLKTMTPNTQRK